jgi:nucleoid-associated protein YejK
MMGNQGNMPNMDPEMAKMMEKDIADLKMKYQAKMMAGGMMDNEKMIDAFLEKMRADPKMFDMFKEKVNKPAPKNP